MITPAEMIAIRAPTVLFVNALGSVDLLASSSGPSPSIFTKPPSGTAASTYSVSPRRNPKSVGPKPIENFSTLTSFHLARRKCPSSWMKMTKPRPKATLKTFQNQLRISNVAPPGEPSHRPSRAGRSRAVDRIRVSRGPRGRRGECPGTRSRRRGTARPPPRWPR